MLLLNQRFPVQNPSLLRSDVSLQFQLDAETLSESLQRLNSTLDPKFLAGKSNPEVLMALEVQWRDFVKMKVCTFIIINFPLFM